MKIVFKNLESSDLTKENVCNKILPILEKFPDLNTHRITITLEMENSSTQAGPDTFSVTLMITGKKIGEFRTRQTSDNLYRALALMTDVAGHEIGKIFKKKKQKEKLPLSVFEIEQRL